MSSEEILTRMELLRIARELVINEYIDRRAQDHNSWLANSDLAWRTQKVKLPYPTFPAYPSELDIISRANILNEFINGADKLAPSIIEPLVVQEIVMPDEPACNTESHVEQESVTVPCEPDIVIPNIEAVDPEPIVIDEAPAVTEQESHYEHILKIFDATEMPAPIIPVELPIEGKVSKEAAEILDIFKPATSGTMESIEAAPVPTLNSIATAVIDAAATRHNPHDDITQPSSFSSLLPNWLLKK